MPGGVEGGSTPGRKERAAPLPLTHDSASVERESNGGWGLIRRFIERRHSGRTEMGQQCPDPTNLGVQGRNAAFLCFMRHADQYPAERAGG